MGTTMITIILILLLVPTVCPLVIFAQASPQPNLPEGAKARLSNGAIHEIAYSPDGERLPIAYTGGIGIYDTSGYQETAFLAGHTADATSVAFSHDGRTLVSGNDSERDGGSIFGAEIRLWGTVTGAHRRTVTAQGSVTCVAFSPDGGTLAGGEGWPEYVVRVWDAVTGAQKYALTGHTDWVEGIAFGPNGEMLASASGDTTIRLWDVATGTHKRTLTGHTSNVVSVAFSPDGSVLASGCADGVALFWDITTVVNASDG